MSLPGLIGQPLAGRSAGGATLARLAPTLASHEVPPHVHDTAHVVAVERGHYLTSADGADGARAGQAMLVFNPPRIEHRDRFAPGQHLSSARFIALAIDWPLWLALASDADPPPQALAWAGPAARPWLLHLSRVLALPDPTPADTEGLAAELAGLASRRREARLDGAARWVRQARDALRDDPGVALAPGGLARLAQQVGVHPVHLARGFRAVVGKAPGDYARAHRLQSAAARLLRGDDALADVALASGYYDQAHFTRAFRAAFGQTPSRWRIRHRR